jgi:LysM repeat protein
MQRKCSCRSSRPTLGRRITVMGWWTALLVAIPSSGVLAQEPLPQTHTVRKGDTLWDLAQHYLKDPFLWPGIFRQNTDVVEDPHWIYPGEILRISPVDMASVPTMDTPVPESASPDSNSSTAAAGDTTASPDSSDGLARGPQQPSMAEEPEEQLPLFSAQRPRTAAEILKTYTEAPYRPLRRSEFYSSGFLTENQRLPFGRVLGPVTPQQIKAVNSRANALPFSTIALEAPRGATYEIGDTLLILQVGRELEPHGDIIVPTGLARIIETVEDRYLANIVATYGPIRNGQRVLPVESFSAGAGRRAVPVSDGVRGLLVGGLGRQELKEPQMIVFINKGREDGVAPGDIFEVRRRPRRFPDGTIHVNELMATLQIVHVRDRTATGLVLTVISPDIPPGTDVLQVAKLPS